MSAISRACLKVVFLSLISDGVDYGLIGGEVSFSGQRSQSSDADCQGITVEIYDDPVVEKSEEVVIKLVSSEPERIKTSDTNKPNLTIIIEDDDGGCGWWVWQDSILFLNYYK